MGVYEENIVPIKIAGLAEYVAERKRISLDEAWLHFVVDSRKGIKHDYDLVFGPVANDKVFTTVNLYESGVLDAPAAIAQLKAYMTYDQLSFHSKRVMDALRFVESYEVVK